MNKPVSILGINCAYHESAACLIQNGELIAAVEEERYNRIKHAKPAAVNNAGELPLQSIRFCLESGNLGSLQQIDYVGYSCLPKDRLKKNTQYKHPYNIPPGDFGTAAGEQVFYEGNLQVEQKLREMGFTGRFFYMDHHHCHAAGAFFVSGYDEAAVLVIDGIGEFESTTWYKGKGTHLSKLGCFEFPNSLGFLWEKMSAYLGFSTYDAAKVMGLSSYGEPGAYKAQLEQVFQVTPDGSFILDDTIVQLRNSDFSGLEAVFGTARREQPVGEVNADTQKYADIAVALQIATEDVFLRLAKTLKDQTGTDYLCISGGVSLNCVANGYLSYAKIFDNFYVQPAANDAGTAIGAAYYIWHEKLGSPRQQVSESPYLGPSYSDSEMADALEQNGLAYEKCDNIEQTAARLIADGNIVGWFQGRMEIGPRALGNRSLLADPRKPETVALLNSKVKHREAFRPFCPSVLADKAGEWVELPNEMPKVADYMLGAFKVLPDKKHIIPAVTHFDGTSRIHTVHKEVNPKYYKLIAEMEKLTGVPLVLNTSFNDGEPVVCSPQDAINTFQKTSIDCLVLGTYLVLKQNGQHHPLPVAH